MSLTPEMVEMVGGPGEAEPVVRREHFVRAALRRPSARASACVLAVIIVACALANLIAPYGPRQQDLLAVNKGPSSDHLLGTDALGRDILSRLLHGGQVTLVGALTAVTVFAAIGIVVGVVAGSAGGGVDLVVTRVTDLFQAMPGLIVLLVVLATLGSSEAVAMVSLGVLASPALVRVVRAAAMAAREELYVTAARVAGLTTPQVQRRHIVPAVAGPAMTQITLFAASAILIEAGLGFLGLGVQPPDPTWGNMVADAQDVLYINGWMLVPTGGVLVVSCLALGLLGNALRDSYSGRSARAHDREQTWGSMRVPVDVVETPSTGTAAALLSVRDLAVTVNDGSTTVVDRIGFDVMPGETVGIVGESGCGKTMAVTAILRVTPAGSRVSAAVCALGGRDLLGLDESEINRVRGREIAYISQEPVSSLDPSFTAGQQVAEAVRQHRKVGSAEARAVAVDLFRRVHLPDPKSVAASYPHELSGGMAQRVAIARALAGQPRLLVADEPTTALDVTVQAEILDLLREIREDTGMAVLLVTHDFGVLADSCDRALVMYAGRIVEDAPVRELISDPRHPYTRALLQSNPAVVTIGQRLPTIPGMVPAPAPWTSGCRFADRCPSARDDCRHGQIPVVAESDRRYQCLHPEHADRARREPAGSGSGMTEPLLEVRDLTVVYRGRRRRAATTALAGVSLTLERGETLAIVGESGSGKSTLGKAILGLVPVVGGAVIWKGRDITSVSGRERRELSREIQAVFQDPYSTFNPHRIVGQSILETLAAARAEHTPEARSRAIDLLAQVGMSATAFDRYPREFSGGQRQRIAIARAVLPEPTLIVCDEVVSALDLSVQAQVINLLGDLQAAHGLSYLFITHDLSVVRHLCQRTIVLQHGQLVEEGPTLDVLDHPREAYTRRLVLAAPLIDPDRQRERRAARRLAIVN